MDEALIGLAGVVVGALLGALGTYFRLRRDAWSEARAHGLMLLADVRARLKDPGRDLAGLLEAWDRSGPVLARFRRGNYPSGYRSREWLELAKHFAALRGGDSTALGRIEKLLARRFEDDPSVFPYVIATSVKEGWLGLVGGVVVAAGGVLGVVDSRGYLLIAAPALAGAIWWLVNTGRSPGE